MRAGQLDNLMRTKKDPELAQSAQQEAETEQEAREAKLTEATQV